MQSMPKQSVFAAWGVMILAAVLGVYFGVSRSLAGPGAASDDATIVPAVTPVASAKPILAPVQTMDEAEVRRLAREEAQAILSKSSSKKAADSQDDTDAASSDQLTPVPPIAPPVMTKPSAPTSQN
jgi:hypothetical protein